MVTNITPNKDIETVAAAAVQLRERVRTCPIYIVGRDPRSLMARAIDRDAAAGALAPLGEVDDRTLRAYYRHALCTVHPSAYEGFSLPVLEAQALGSPVVCTRRGALPEVAGEGALYLDYGDSAQLVQAIESLLDNPREREALIFHGESNVRRFSWDRAAEGTETLFKEVLGLSWRACGDRPAGGDRLACRGARSLARRFACLVGLWEFSRDLLAIVYRLG